MNPPDGSHTKASTISPRPVAFLKMTHECSDGHLLDIYWSIPEGPY